MVKRSPYQRDSKTIHRKGVKSLTDVQDRLEIDRLGNLITGFGWSIKKQEFTEDKIMIQIEKKRAPGVEVPEAGPG